MSGIEEAHKHSQKGTPPDTIDLHDVANTRDALNALTVWLAGREQFQEMHSEAPGRFTTKRETAEATRRLANAPRDALRGFQLAHERSQGWLQRLSESSRMLTDTLRHCHEVYKAPEVGTGAF